MNSAIEVLRSEVTESEAIFTIGELRFRVPKGEYLALIDRGTMEERFRLAVKANADFAAFDNAPTYARVYRLLKKGLTIEEVARVMGADDQALRKFWAYAVNAYRDRLDADQEIERQGREEKDYCATQGFYELGQAPWNSMSPLDEGKKIPEIFVNAGDVHRGLARTGDVAGVAKSLTLDLKDFQIWIEKNQYVLDVWK